MIGLLEFLTGNSASGQFVMLTIKSGLVVALGLATYAGLRRASASTRHIVLGASLFAIILLPAISYVSPELYVPITRLEAVAEKVAPNPSPVTGDRQPADRVPAVATPTRPTTVWTAANLITACYALGVLGALLYLLTGVLRVWWITRSAFRTEDDPIWCQLIADTERRVKTPRLRMSAAIAAPLTWGVVAPTVLLPASARDWSDQDRRNAMLHELAHVERRDWLTQMLSRIVCAVYWFNPLVWIVARKLTLEAEHAADDKVLASGSCPDDYAEQLIAQTRQQRRQNRLPLAASPMAARSLLKQRVASILNAGENRMPANNFSKTLLVANIAVITLLVGSVRPVIAVAAESATDNGLHEDGDLHRSSGSPLHDAVADGHYGEVVRLIEDGANIDATIRRSYGPYQRTALGTAARGGHTDIARRLIEAGADVNRVRRGDASALIEALRFDRQDTVRALIDNGADVNLVVRGDGSPLISATTSGSADMVRLLLDRGADPDTWVRGDENPLYHAARSGNADIMRMLIDAGVDINRQMRGDGNALIISIRNGNDEVTSMLIDAGARADAGTKGDGNAMIAAAQRGDVVLLQKMIATGADVNVTFKGDGSPLIAASRNHHLEAAQLLVNNGADVNLYVYGDETPLIGAAWQGDLEMVNYLLSAGADPTFKAPTYGGRKRSALSQASKEGHTEVVEILKAAGAVE